jgi:hypothetical protein
MTTSSTGDGRSSSSAATGDDVTRVIVASG